MILVMFHLVFIRRDYTSIGYEYSLTFSQSPVFLTCSRLFGVPYFYVCQS